MKNYESDQFGIQLGKAVKKLREQKNMTQEDLREKAKFGTGYISRLEGGGYSSPSISQIFQIAKALDMNLRDLLEYARLIPEHSSFEACLRGEGYTEEQINEIIKIKDYVFKKSPPDADQKS